MTGYDKVAFLDTKQKLLASLIDPAEAHMLEKLFAHFATGDVGTIPSSALRELDRKLERLIVEWVLEEDASIVRSELKRQFGFSSFGDEPEKVLRRILRERKIRSEEEAKLVQDFLSGSYLGWTSGDERRKRLSQILASFERGLLDDEVAG